MHFKRVSHWLLRGTALGAVFAAVTGLVVLNSLRTQLPEFPPQIELPPFTPPLASVILEPALLAFLLGLATSGLWAWFARSRLGLLWAILAGYATITVLSFALTFSSLNRYLFAATIAASDIPNHTTVPAAIFQLSGRTPQPLYLTVLSYLSGPLLGAALWAGLRWAKLRRL